MTRYRRHGYQIEAHTLANGNTAFAGGIGGHILTNAIDYSDSIGQVDCCHMQSVHLGDDCHSGISVNVTLVSAAIHVALDGDLGRRAIADNHYRVGCDITIIAATEDIACIFRRNVTTDIVDGQVGVGATDGAFKNLHLR